MAHERILLIEDDRAIADLIRHHLVKEGYHVSSADTGEAGLRSAQSRPPQAVILDLMLPGMDGWEVCKLLKADSKTRSVPVLILTAKTEEADIVTGLELGAGDYLAKPFSPKVLIARLRNLLRRHAPETAAEAAIRVRDLTIHPGRHEILIAGKPAELTFTEFKVLELLAGRPGWVFTRNQIVEAIRGEGYAVTDRAVDVQIVGLRRKLGRAGRYIETVRGVGYRFQE